MTVKKKNDSAGAWGFFFLLVVGYAGYGLWQQAKQQGWVSHEVVATVIAKDWSIGEYKTCSEANSEAMQEQPQIDCSNTLDSGQPKEFQVSFYGDTYKPELKDKATFLWRCQKIDGTDPAFTCDQPKTIDWVGKK